MTEKLEQQFEKRNKLMDEIFEQQSREQEQMQEELKRHNEEQVRQIRLDLQDYTKRVSTVGSNVKVSSNLRNRQTKKRNDLVSLHLMRSEDDYHDVDRDCLLYTSRCV